MTYRISGVVSFKQLPGFQMPKREHSWLLPLLTKRLLNSRGHSRSALWASARQIASEAIRALLARKVELNCFALPKSKIAVAADIVYVKRMH